MDFFKGIFQSAKFTDYSGYYLFAFLLDYFMSRIFHSEITEEKTVL